MVVIVLVCVARGIVARPGTKNHNPVSYGSSGRVDDKGGL